MTQTQTLVVQRVLQGIQHDIRDWTHAMNIGAGFIGMDSARISNELHFCAEYWESTIQQIKEKLQTTDSITIEFLDNLYTLLPPHRAIYRFQLERQTATYKSFVRSHGTNIAELYEHAEDAIDRGDLEIGKNLLNHLLQESPRFFPALLVKAMLLLSKPSERHEACRILEMASTLPLFSDPNNRYKHLCMELLAHSSYLADRPQNAIKATKRVLNIGQPTASYYYNLARFYAMGGQVNDVLNNVELAIDLRPSLLALSLVDRDFQRVKNHIVDLLNKKNEDLGQATVDNLSEAKSVIELTQKHFFLKHSKTLREGEERYNKMQSQLADGCYCVYRDILNNQLYQWLRDIPGIVTREIGDEISRRHRDIDNHNAALDDFVAARKRTVMRIYVPMAGSISMLVFILTLLAGQPPLQSLFFLMLLLLLGYAGMRGIEGYLWKSVQESRRNYEELLELKDDIGQVQKQSQTVLGRMKDGGYGPIKEELKI